MLEKWHCFPFGMVREYCNYTCLVKMLVEKGGRIELREGRIQFYERRRTVNVELSLLYSVNCSVTDTRLQIFPILNLFSVSIVAGAVN